MVISKPFTRTRRTRTCTTTTTRRVVVGAARLEAADAEELRSELRQNLQKLQESLLDLESAPDETEPLHEAFRRLHAAKGDFTMLEAEAAAGMAHHLETLLDLLRAHRVELEPRRVDLLLDAAGWLLRAAEAPLGAFRRSRRVRRPRPSGARR